MSSLERVVIWLHIRRPYLTLTSLTFRVSEGRSAVIRKSFIKFLAREMVIPTQESREIDIALLEVSHGSKAVGEIYIHKYALYTYYIIIIILVTREPRVALVLYIILMHFF